jgi:membrane protein YdbS with pleckstrin-like domain
MKIYVPCGMIVVISWISFWLGENFLDARVSLAITTILTMVLEVGVVSIRYRRKELHISQRVKIYPSRNSTEQ